MRSRPSARRATRWACQILSNSAWATVSLVSYGTASWPGNLPRGTADCYPGAWRILHVAQPRSASCSSVRTHRLYGGGGPLELPGNPQSAGPGVAAALALVRELAVERGEELGVSPHREFQAGIEAGGIARRGRAVDNEIIAGRRKERWVDRAVRLELVYPGGSQPPCGRHRGDFELGVELGSEEQRKRIHDAVCIAEAEDAGANVRRFRIAVHAQQPVLQGGK